MGRGGCHCRGHPRVRSSPPQQGDPQAWLFKGQLLVFGLRCPESDPSCPPSTFASVAPDMVGVELCPCGAINRPRSLTTRACTFPIHTRQPAIPNGSKQTPPLPLASIPDTAFGPHPLPPVDVPSKHRHGAHGGQARGPRRAGGEKQLRHRILLGSSAPLAYARGHGAEGARSASGVTGGSCLCQRVQGVAEGRSQLFWDITPLY